MNSPSYPNRRTKARAIRFRQRGFTIVEVAIAATILVLAISSSLIVLQQGLRAIDNARYTTLAGQILQSQMEKLRMLNWTQFTYVNTSTTPSSGGPLNYTTFTTDVSSSTAQINRFTFLQEITPTAGNFNPTPITTLNVQMYDIKLTANWTGMDGRPHTLSYKTRYLKNGISSFFYTTVPKN